MSSTSTSAMVRLILTCWERLTHGIESRDASPVRSDDETSSVRTNDRHPDRRTLTEESGSCQAVTTQTARTRESSKPVGFPIKVSCQLKVVRRKVFCQSPSQCWIHWRR